MNLPHANASVTSVTAHGYTDDWSSASAAGSVTWTGTADAVVRDERRNVYGNGESSTVISRTVVVPADLALTIGDTLTVTWRGAASSMVVKGIVRREPPRGVSGTTLVEVEIT